MMRSPVHRPWTWRVVQAALADITREQLTTAFLFGCGYFLYKQGFNLQMMLHTPHFNGRPLLIGITFVACELGAFSLLACIAVAEKISGKAARQAVYVFAIIASAVMVGGFEMIPRAATFRFNPSADAAERSAELFDAVWNGFFQWLIIGGAATFVYVDHRRAKAAQARMHAAQLERTRAARHTLESRLQAMQARVEPQFLFNTLAQVRDLYRVDPPRAERMFDELIAYLRAAMPKRRDTSSTIGQELELVRAYLAIANVRFGGRLQYFIDAPDELDAVPMPPMMLLPVIAHALEQEQATHDLHIDGRIVDGRLRVSIGVDSAMFRSDHESEAISGVKERLAALYGADARLVLHSASGKSEALIEIPAGRATGPGVHSTPEARQKAAVLA